MVWVLDLGYAFIEHSTFSCSARDRLLYDECKQPLAVQSLCEQSRCYMEKDVLQSACKDCLVLTLQQLGFRALYT